MNRRMDRRHAAEEANSKFIIPQQRQRRRSLPSRARERAYLYYKTLINPCFHYHKSNAIKSCTSAGRMPSHGGRERAYLRACPCVYRYTLAATYCIRLIVYTMYIVCIHIPPRASALREDYVHVERHVL